MPIASGSINFSRSRNCAERRESKIEEGQKGLKGHKGHKQDDGDPFRPFSPFRPSSIRSLIFNPHFLMSQAHLPPPNLLIIAAFSRHEEALRWAGERLPALFGPIARTSSDFSFNQTRYYESAPRGRAGLRTRARAPGGSPPPPTAARGGEAPRPGSRRRRAREARQEILEQELARAGHLSESRPVNLDPGALSLGKFLLATTKDQAHRIYLRAGIYAETTLRFQDHAFQPWPWTYADYRQPEVLAFLGTARDYYRQRLASRDALVPEGGSIIED